MDDTFYASVNQTNWISGTKYYTKITDDNHAGWLYIITLMSLVYMTTVFVVRFIVKYGLYGIDDWALLGATVLAAGQHVAVLAGLAFGLGKSVSLLHGSQLGNIQKVSIGDSEAARRTTDISAVHRCSRVSVRSGPLRIEDLDSALDAEAVFWKWPQAQHLPLLGSSRCFRLVWPVLGTGTCCSLP